MKAAIILLLASSGLRAAACQDIQLTEKERLAKFQQLDRLAEAAFEQKQYVDAARYYREAACVAPKSARAFYGLGTAYAAAGNFPAAREAFETADALLPDNMLPLTMLVRVHVAMKDIDRVKKALRTAAKRFPKSAELHAGLARFLAENQLLDLALAESLRAAESGARDAESLVALAALENTVGAFHDAIRTASAVEDDPRAPDAIKASASGVAGLSYESIGRRQDAIEHLEAAIEKAPAQENSYLALAFIYEKAHQFSEAVKVLEQARARMASSSALLLALGNNLVWAGEHRRGEQVLKELLQRDANAADAYVRLAEAYRNTNQTRLEIDALQKLAKIRPDYPMIHILTAQAMLRMDPVDNYGVLQELAKAEKAAPDDADVFYLRGKVYLAMNRLTEAVTALKRSIELRPTEAGPYYQLGLAYRKLGRVELAREMFQRVEFLKQQPAAP
jgi:tetratricopeptide (TPR) repeat protein